MITRTPGHIWSGGEVVTPLRLNNAISKQTVTAAHDTLLGVKSKPDEENAPEAGDVEEIPCTAKARELLASDDAAAMRAVIELDKVDNTSDANKPVSNSQQEALDAIKTAVEKLQDELQKKINQALVPGEFKLFLHPKEALPSGWFFPDGRLVDLTSDLGVALQALPAAVKSAWGVTSTAYQIRLFDPDKFFTKDGAGNTVGRFPRLAGLGSQQAGTAQADAIRNITGYAAIRVVSSQTSGTSPSSGGFGQDNGGGSWGALKADNSRYWDNSGGSSDGGGTIFDASLTVPTADENRPFNVGMTPGIYLGVTGVPSYVAQ